jgi:hypothetical protein
MKISKKNTSWNFLIGSLLRERERERESRSNYGVLLQRLKRDRRTAAVDGGMNKWQSYNTLPQINYAVKIKATVDNQ